jgi:dTDP-4-dehydrorhamnose 3,5-epimerase
MAFRFKKMSLPDVVVVEADWYGDDRGYFKELYKESVFSKGCGLEDFVQVNFSHSKRHVLRGLHYQKKPEDQGKLLMVTKGSVFDVAVDIRKDSSHYGKWVGVEISESNNKMFYIPSGFAHGFCVVSEEADVQYFCTKEYSPEHERGIIWSDPEIGIKWPTEQPILSDKDREFGSLKEADNNF